MGMFNGTTCGDSSCRQGIGMKFEILFNDANGTEERKEGYKERET
jgi:hypothetical protein